MNVPRQHPNSESLTKMVIDQMAEQGIAIENSPSKVEQVNKELAEENGQKDASWKSAPAPEVENQSENNDYYSGMSQ